MSGYVYIARREDGRIKIGMSGRTEMRLREMAIQYRQRFTLLAEVYCAEPRRVERALHFLNAAYLAEGREWFDMPASQVRKARRLLRDPDALARVEIPRPPRVFTQTVRFYTSLARKGKLAHGVADLKAAGWQGATMQGVFNLFIDRHLDEFAAELERNAEWAHVE